jgi:hypothetical protein
VVNCRYLCDNIISKYSSVDNKEIKEWLTAGVFVVI